MGEILDMRFLGRHFFAHIFDNTFLTRALFHAHLEILGIAFLTRALFHAHLGILIFRPGVFHPLLGNFTIFGAGRTFLCFFKGRGYFF